MRPNFYAALTERPPARKRHPHNIEFFVQRQVRRQILSYCGYLRWVDWALLEILDGDTFLPRKRTFAERTRTIELLFQELEGLAPGLHEEKLKKAWFSDTVIYGSTTAAVEI